MVREMIYPVTTKGEPTRLASSHKSLNFKTFREEYPSERSRLHRLQILARLEADRLARWDGNFLACSGVSANAGLPRLDGENTKPTKLNAIISSESRFHGFKN
jgi:hypothetical protein